MIITRGGSRTAATSKMQCFVIIVNGLDRFMIIVNGWKPLTFITKRSILDVAAALDPPLINIFHRRNTGYFMIFQNKTFEKSFNASLK